MFFKSVATLLLMTSVAFHFPNAAGLPEQVSTSSSSSSEASSFMQSWQSLDQGFSQCQSTFSQHSSAEVAYQSAQNLYSTYESTVKQYNSCSSCATSLSAHKSEIEKSLSHMFTCYQSIIQTGRKQYGSQWNSQFVPEFKQMSGFESFCEKVCAPIGINVKILLSSLGIDLNLFADVGINLNIGGILG